MEVGLNMGKLTDKVDRFKHIFGNYLSEYKDSYKQLKEKKKDTLLTAASISAEEINEKITEIVKNPKPLQLVSLVKTLTNSGVWVSTSTLRYLLSVVDFTSHIEEKKEDDKVEMILDYVSRGEDLPIDEVSHEEIFKTIYNELEFSHYHPSYQSKLKLPDANVTIVLVSGVLNEIFSTPAFERGALHLSKEIGVKVFSPEVKGTKGTKTNAKLLEEQLFEYAEKNPEEKLWIFAFSKGGLDSLHFLKDNPDFANEHIIGLSTIASPILGSPHTDHKLLKLINGIHKFEDTKLYKFLEKEQDLLFREIYDSLSHRYQTPWFERNHQFLPENLFYTSMAFSSSWHESHLYMILAKLFFLSNELNDGVVEANQANFPAYFHRGHNLGVIKGHHLVGMRSSQYCQEALLEAHIIFLHYLNKF